MVLRRIVLVVVVIALAVLAFAAGSINQAGSAESRRSLLAVGADLVVEGCDEPFDGSAVVTFPEGSFDRDSVIHVTATDPEGWASGGGDTWSTFRSIVRIHVPAGAATGVRRVAVVATGTRHGRPVARRDTLRVSVRCSAR